MEIAHNFVDVLNFDTLPLRCIQSNSVPQHVAIENDDFNIGFIQLLFYGFTKERPTFTSNMLLVI